jgi:hypothetical protein
MPKHDEDVMRNEPTDATATVSDPSVSFTACGSPVSNACACHEALSHAAG